jgi:hypothetical protein
MARRTKAREEVKTTTGREEVSRRQFIKTAEDKLKMKHIIAFSGIGLMFLPCVPAQAGTFLLVTEEFTENQNCNCDQSKWVSNHNHVVTHVDPSDVQCPCHSFSGTQTSENTNWAAGGYNIPPGKKAVEKHIQQWDNIDSFNLCEGTTPGWCIEGGTYRGHYFVAEIKDC